MRPKKGQRYKAIRDARLSVLVTYKNPSSGAFGATLPEGEIVVVANDPPAHATGAYALPERYEGLEAVLVPAPELSNRAYQSYVLMIRFTQLEADFQFIADT